MHEIQGAREKGLAQDDRAQEVREEDELEIHLAVDLDALPRALVAGAGELRWRTGWASWVASAGLGAAIVGRADDWTVNEICHPLMPIAAHGWSIGSSSLSG